MVSGTSMVIIIEMLCLTKQKIASLDGLVLIIMTECKRKRLQRDKERYSSITDDHEIKIRNKEGHTIIDVEVDLRLVGKQKCQKKFL